MVYLLYDKFWDPCHKKEKQKVIFIPFKKVTELEDSKSN